MACCQIYKISGDDQFIYVEWNYFHFHLKFFFKKEKPENGHPDLRDKKAGHPGFSSLLSLVFLCLDLLVYLDKTETAALQGSRFC